MKKKSLNKVRSYKGKDMVGKRSTKPWDSFFQKPAVVFLICVLLFGMTVWTFAPALQCDFQRFDDEPIFLLNSHVNTGLNWENLRWALFSTDYAYSYPLTRISHMLDFEMYGAHPWGHHLTNVLLHAANAVLLFLVLKRMTGAPWRSLIVALLFALHPLRVESVAWVSERKDVLSTFFCLLALWMYARYAEESKVRSPRSKAFYGWTLLFFAFGLLSKSMMVTFPFLLLLLDYWPLKRMANAEFANSEYKRPAGRKNPLLPARRAGELRHLFCRKVGGGTVYCCIFPGPCGWKRRVMGYGRYIGLMFWPVKLSAIYPYPDHWPAGQLVCAAALFLGMSALAIIWHRQRPYLLVGWLWFVGMLVPVIGLITIGGESICTRFTYIPMMGALVLLVWGIEDLTKRWRQRAAIVTLLVVLAAVACVTRTRAEIGYWKDGVTLYKRAIAVTTNNFMAHYCLATILSGVDPEEEMAEYQKSVDVYPDYENAQRELGVMLLKYKRYPEAAGHFEKAIQLNPQDGWAYHDLGLAFLKLGQVADSIPMFLKAAEVDPPNVSHINALDLIFHPGDNDTAIISNLLAAARSDPAGFKVFLDEMQFDTNHIFLINNLALSFAICSDRALRNGEYAVRLATRACEMTGFRTNFCVATLAAADAEDSRFDEAISNAELACSLTSGGDQPELLKQYQALLKLVQSHQSYPASTK